MPPQAQDDHYQTFGPSSGTRPRGGSSRRSPRCTTMYSSSVPQRIPRTVRSFLYWRGSQPNNATALLWMRYVRMIDRMCTCSDFVILVSISRTGSKDRSRWVPLRMTAGGLMLNGYLKSRSSTSRIWARTLPFSPRVYSLRSFMLAVTKFCCSTILSMRSSSKTLRSGSE